MSARPTLPGDFARRVLTAEMELEQTVERETVEKLVGLYRLAVEFYDYWGDSRFVDYQARLHQLLLRPGLLEHLSSVHSALSPRPSPLISPRCLPPASPSPHPTPKSALLPSRSPLESPSQELSSQMPIKQDRKLELMMDTQRRETSHACTKAKQDVADQCSLLNSRLARRKGHNHKASVDLSSSTAWAERGRRGSDSLSDSPQHRSIAESDKSGGISKQKPGLDSMTEQIEEVMERMCADFTGKAAAIRLRYQTQIQTVESEMNGSEFMRKIVENMRKAEESELADLQKELNAQQRAQLSQLGFA